MGNIWAVGAIVLNFIMEVDSIKYYMAFREIRFLKRHDVNNSNSLFLVILNQFSDGLSLFKLIYIISN